MNNSSSVLFWSVVSSSFTKAFRCNINIIETRAMFVSMALLPLGSVLMSVTLIAMDDQAEACNLGRLLRPCWCLRIMWLSRAYRSGWHVLPSEAMLVSGPNCGWGSDLGPWPYHSKDLNWYLWLLLPSKAEQIPQGQGCHLGTGWHLSAILPLAPCG